MQTKTLELKSKLITGIEEKEAQVLEKKLQYQGLSKFHEDAVEAETMVLTRYEQVKTSIEEFGERALCPRCAKPGPEIVQALKDQIPGLESELATRHEETELLGQRLSEIEKDISEMETEIAMGLRHNRAIQVEICFLQAEEQLQTVEK